MDLHNHFDFTAQGRRPTVAQIIAAWKKAGRPARFSVQYGETEAEFEKVLGIRWDDSGNGCRGVDRNAVIKALALDGYQITQQASGKFSIYTDTGAESMADETLLRHDIKTREEAELMLRLGRVR